MASTVSVDGRRRRHTMPSTIPRKNDCMGDQKVTRSSGNVFADLGLPQSEERLVAVP